MGRHFSKQQIGTKIVSLCLALCMFCSTISTGTIRIFALEDDLPQETLEELGVYKPSLETEDPDKLEDTENKEEVKSVTLVTDPENFFTEGKETAGDTSESAITGDEEPSAQQGDT